MQQRYKMLSSIYTLLSSPELIEHNFGYKAIMHFFGAER